MQKDSKVSIILPNFNSYPYIKDAVNSILNQSHKNWELIIKMIRFNRKKIQYKISEKTF